MMSKRNTCWIILLLCLTTLYSCATNEEPADKPGIRSGFQLNDTHDPYDDFEIFSIMKDGGTLEEIYDTIDGKGVSDKFSDVVNANKKEFINFADNISDLLYTRSDLVSKLLNAELRETLAWLIDNDLKDQSTLYDYDGAGHDELDAFYNPAEETYYMDSFYSFLDDLSDENEAGARKGMKEVLRVASKIIQYMLDTNDENELRDDVQEVIDDLLDEDFHEDFTDITETLGKLLIEADYPMWLDDDDRIIPTREQINPNLDKNSHMGNGVKGLNILVRWVNRMMADKENRDLVNTIIREVSGLFNPDDADANKTMLKKLTTTMEDLFTHGGDTYINDIRYHQSDDEIESDSELSQLLRHLYPSLVQVFLRSDRDASMLVDNDWDQQIYPLYQTVQYLKNLDYDPDGFEKSFLDILQYDFMGRDRTDPDSGAWPTSFVEHIVYEIALVMNFGYDDGGSNGEIDPATIDPRKDHGHGRNRFALSINDCLFNLKTHALLETGNTSLLNLFDLTLKPTDGENVSRSYKPFKPNDMSRKPFYFDADYIGHGLLTGACAQESATPDGGNIDAYSNEMNSYRAYDPTGRDEPNTAAWILAALIRTIFNGEGPYYYADPNARTVGIDGKTYFEYLRPNGRVYALVNKDGAEWEYIYPSDLGDGEDKNTNEVTGYIGPKDKAAGNRVYRKQRFNRYKAEWDSEHYMVKVPLLFGNSYISPDNASGTLKTTTISSNEYSNSLHYKELIPENEPRRACASPLEAFHRNWLYYSTEKKIVVILPFYLSLDLNTLGLGEGSVPLGALYLTVEVNGFRGFAEARKFKNNHVWAKKGDTGDSTIPGDYRIEMAANLITNTIDLGLIGGITEQIVYDSVLDIGQLVPAVIGKNSYTVSRLAFPRSPVADRGNNITDRDLGSLDFEVSDSVWEHRNNFLPLFISLLAAMYDNSPVYPNYNNPANPTDIKGGYMMLLEALMPLIKPLVYFQKTEGTLPYNCWKPRVYGDTLSNYGDHLGNAFLQSSADMYDRNNPLTHWNGNEEERIFYLPTPTKTLLGVLIDSDINDVNSRMDGLLPTLLSKTKVVSSALRMLMSDVNDTDELYQGLEQIVTSLKSTKSEMTRILEGEAEYGPGGSNKRYIYPDWFFVEGDPFSKDVYGVYQEFQGARAEDLIFDRAVDALVGQDKINEANDGYGIANYPDDKPTLNDPEWKDFEDGYDDLVNLIHKDSPYSLTESIINITESFFGSGYIYSDEQIKGLLYGAGKLFTYYDREKERWIHQGETGFDDIYRILVQSLPDLHEELKDEPRETNGNVTYDTSNYTDILTITTGILEQDGMLDYIIDTVSIEAPWELVFGDLDTFLQQDFIINKDPLWSTVAELLLDMSLAIDNSQEIELESIYQQYGFQLN